jgi:membrane AbrB-like protein
VLTASGYLDGSIPREIYYLGQFLIGIAVGARFRREIVRKLLQLSGIVTGFILVMMVALLGYAWVMSNATSIDFASAALASSPGGFAEMTVTAQTLHLDVALVAAFHIFRAFFINGLATYTWALFDRLGLSAIGRRLGASQDDT